MNLLWKPNIWAVSLILLTSKSNFSQSIQVIYCNNLANFYQILRRFISKFASPDTMIVTTLFFTSFSSLLRGILGYFWTNFCVCFSFFENHLIFSHEILYRCLWYYADGYYINNIFCVISSTAGGILAFLWALWPLMTTLWPLFMDWVQLYKAAEAQLRDSLLFTTKSPEGPGLSISLAVLVLPWQSLHKIFLFYLIPPLLGAIFMSFWVHVVFVYISLCLKKLY